MYAVLWLFYPMTTKKRHIPPGLCGEVRLRIMKTGREHDLWACRFEKSSTPIGGFIAGCGKPLCRGHSLPTGLPDRGYLQPPRGSESVPRSGKCRCCSARPAHRQPRRERYRPIPRLWVRLAGPGHFGA